MAFRKLTPDVKERVLQAIRLGATYEHACAFAGIAYDTLWRYRKDPSFRREVEKAEGQAVIGWLARIEKAASEGTWQAAAWKLERRYPQLYGRIIQEHTSDPDRPVVFTLKIGERDDPALAPPTPLRALEAGDGA